MQAGDKRQRHRLSLLAEAVALAVKETVNKYNNPRGGSTNPLKGGRACHQPVALPVAANYTDDTLCHRFIDILEWVALGGELGGEVSSKISINFLE
ncbi:hypothetical protein ACLKA7_005179 [Drosophila subpalustris]